jgi:hypothetical protein
MEGWVSPVSGLDQESRYYERSMQRNISHRSFKIIWFVEVLTWVSIGVTSYRCFCKDWIQDSLVFGIVWYLPLFPSIFLLLRHIFCAHRFQTTHISSPGATCKSLHACDFTPMRSFLNVKILKPSIHWRDLSSMLVNPCGLCMYTSIKRPKALHLFLLILWTPCSDIFYVSSLCEFFWQT